MGDARIIDFKRQIIGLRVLCGGRDNVLTLPGADFDDQRVGVAPRVVDPLACEPPVISDVQRPFRRI